MVDPAACLPFDGPGCTIAQGPALARYSLRARDSAVLAKLLGTEVPSAIGETAGGIACLGPDEWLLRLAPATAVPNGEGQPLSVVEISDRQVGFVLDGPRAIEALEAGCPRSVAAMAVGEARRTVYEGVEIVLFRTADMRWEVEVWRSFSDWLRLALITAARHPR